MPELLFHGSKDEGLGVGVGEIIAAVALQQCRDVRITARKALIAAFGSAQAVCSASEDELKRNLPKCLWSKLPLTFDFDRAEEVLSIQRDNHIRIIFSYLPENSSQQGGAHVQATNRLEQWGGSPFIWYEAGLPVDYSRQHIGVIAPNTPNSRADSQALCRLHDSPDRVTVIQTGAGDTILLRSLLQENIRPVLIIPFGFTADQLQSLCGMYPGILDRATVLSPFPAGLPALTYCYHFRNRFFSHFIDSLIMLSSQMSPVHTLITDIVRSQGKQVVTTTDQGTLPAVQKGRDLLDEALKASGTPSVEAGITETDSQTGEGNVILSHGTLQETVLLQLESIPCTMEELQQQLPNIRATQLKQLLVELSLEGVTDYRADGRWHLTL